MYGIAPVFVTNRQTVLQPQIQMPEVLRPETCFSSAGLQFTTGYGGNGTIVDAATAIIPAAAGGRALVSIENGSSVLHWEWIEVTTDAVYLIFQVGTVHRLSLRINGHDIKDEWKCLCPK